jgi:C4-dicarboxylate transporter DctM subunit
VAALTAIIIGFFQRTLKIGDIPKILETSAKVSGVIVPIIAMSLPLAQTLASLQVPQAFVSFMTSLTSNPYLIIIIMVAILMIAGCVMETTPNIVILAPLLLPLALEIGMNEVHFCIFMITSLGIGFITPTHGLEPVRGFRRHRDTDRIHLQICLSVCFLHAGHRAVDRLRPMDFTLVD